mgnify:CR=1 FL=1
MRHSFLGAGSCYEKNVFLEAYFQNTVDLVFEDGMYPVPADYDGLLTQLYGDYMKMPPKEKQVPEHSDMEIKVYG